MKFQIIAATVGMFVATGAIAAADLPPMDWDNAPFVSATKQPNMPSIENAEDYIEGGCKIVRKGGTQTVTVHIAFLVDDKGAIKKVQAKDEGCKELEKKISINAWKGFKGVVQPAPTGEMAWYQTEIEQSWR